MRLKYQQITEFVRDSYTFRSRKVTLCILDLQSLRLSYYIHYLPGRQKNRLAVDISKTEDRGLDELLTQSALAYSYIGTYSRVCYPWPEPLVLPHE